MITNFKVSDKRNHSKESCDSLSVDRHRSHSKGYKEVHLATLKTVQTVQVVKPNANVVTAVRVEKESRNNNIYRESRLHREDSQRGRNSSTKKEEISDYKYWLGRRPGQWYDANKKDYIHDSRDASHNKNAVKVTSTTVSSLNIVQNVQGYH